MSISSCYDEIRMYNELRIKLFNVLNGLSYSVSCISSIPGLITSNYNIDDNQTPISNRFNNLGNDIVSTQNYISQAILPAIDTAIYNKRVEIFNLEQQERMGRY